MALGLGFVVWGLASVYIIWALYEKVVVKGDGLGWNATWVRRSALKFCSSVRSQKTCKDPGEAPAARRPPMQAALPLSLIPQLQNPKLTQSSKMFQASETLLLTRLALVLKSV